jgi:hypothetical protein
MRNTLVAGVANELLAFVFMRVQKITEIFEALGALR